LKPGPVDRRALRKEPLFLLALCAIVLAVFAALFSFAAKTILAQHRLAAFDREVRARDRLLDQLSRSAIFPLLGEDAAILGHLVQAPPERDGFLYAFVVDGDNVIRAHTDPSQVGEIFRSPVAPVASVGEVLLLTRPMAFRERPVGTAGIALSRPDLERQADREVLPLKRSLAALGGLAFAGIILLGAASALRVRFARRTFAAGLSAGGKDSVAYRVQPIDRGQRIAFSVPEGAGEPEAPKELQIHRNPATVLVTNVRGFRAYSNNRRAEELVEGLNAYFQVVEQAVASHGGCVERLSGDMMVAMFGGATILPDHTNQAVRAALAIQKGLHEADGGGNGLFGRVTIGISSGVVLTCDGGGVSRDRTIRIGESFKAAAALASVGGPGEIIIGREVYQNLGFPVSADPVPPRETRDRTESWETFRIQDETRPGA